MKDDFYQELKSDFKKICFTFLYEIRQKNVFLLILISLLKIMLWRGGY